MRKKGQSEPASFGRAYAQSETFSELFRASMILIEETSEYLDGDGRKESKRLNPTIAVLYTTESMRLTTRLMQLASWLLLHRSVKDGDMTIEQAIKEKAKIQIDRLTKPIQSASWNELPVTFRRLHDASLRLLQRIEIIDRALLSPDGATENRNNPVAHQLSRIANAFPKPGERQVRP